MLAVYSGMYIHNVYIYGNERRIKKGSDVMETRTNFPPFFPAILVAALALFFVLCEGVSSVVTFLFSLTRFFSLRIFF